mmetsp:Transcript_26980/g.53121  ORF Transcript_26980/g.53121 Transcript_26980/m.53121 type:complete len:136 (-) Transcript_26980:525-932(-)
MVFVYVDEAHAQDEWPVGAHLNSLPNVEKQCKTTSERVKVVQDLMMPFLKTNAPSLLPDPSDPNACRWLLDAPEDSFFEKLYAPWPLRFWIVHKGRLAYIAEPTNGQFSVEELGVKLGELGLVEGPIGSQFCQTL